MLHLLVCSPEGFVLTLSGWFAPPITEEVHRVRTAGPLMLLIGAGMMVLSCGMCTFTQKKCCTCCYYFQNYKIQLRFCKIQKNICHQDRNVSYFYKNPNVDQSEGDDSEFVTAPLLSTNFTTSNVTVAGLDMLDAGDGGKYMQSNADNPPRGTMQSYPVLENREERNILDQVYEGDRIRSKCTLIEIHSRENNCKYANLPKDTVSSRQIDDDRAQTSVLSCGEPFVLYRNLSCSKPSSTNECVQYINMTQTPSASNPWRHKTNKSSQQQECDPSKSQLLSRLSQHQRDGTTTNELPSNRVTTDGFLDHQMKSKRPVVLFEDSDDVVIVVDVNEKDFSDELENTETIIKTTTL